MVRQGHFFPFDERSFKTMKIIFFSWEWTFFHKCLSQYSDAVFSYAVLSLEKDSSAQFPFDKLTHILRIKIVAYEM